MIDIKDIRVFISYSSADKETAMNMCDYLEKNGKKCWIAPRNIPAGAEYGESIINGIEHSDVFVLVFSEMSNKSQHVLREVERAVSKNIPIISCRLDDTQLSKSLEYFLLTNQWLDTASGKGKMLDNLNSSIDVIAADEETKAAVSDEFTSSKKAGANSVPIILGVIAIGIIAIAVILAISFSALNNSGNPSDTSVPTTVSDTIADTSAPPEATTTAVTTASDTTEATTSAADTSETAVPAAATVADETSPTTETTTVTEAPATTEPAPAAPVLKTGNFISFGKYYPTGYSAENGDEELLWQILSYDEETGIAKLITDRIVDIKPYDCAESGTYDKNNDGESYDRTKLDSYTDEQMKQFRGSSEWKTSDIRTWLNSDGKVTYSSKSQANSATDEHGNSFGSQKGFLSAFSDAEKSVLVETNLPEGTKDKVYLLSKKEVEEYAGTQYFILHTELTKSAAASDETSWHSAYEATGIDDYFWATRTPYEIYLHQVYVVETLEGQELFTAKNAAISGFGIRPAVTVNLNGLSVSGDGTEYDPYVILR